MPRSYSSRPVFEKVAWSCLFLLIGKTKTPTAVPNVCRKIWCVCRFVWLQVRVVCQVVYTAPSGTQGFPDIRMLYLMLYLCVHNIMDRPNYCYRISSLVFPLRTSYSFFFSSLLTQNGVYVIEEIDKTPGCTLCCRCLNFSVTYVYPVKWSFLINSCILSSRNLLVPAGRRKTET